MASLCYAVVHNIPASYHSKDLRSFFHKHVECGTFDCFHFKHRPEKKLAHSVAGNKMSDQSCSSSMNTTCGNRTNFGPEDTESTCCCMVRFSNAHHRNQIINFYNGKHFTNCDGKRHNALLRCFIAPIKSSDDFLSCDVPELRPPVNLMPNGNIGTPLAYFREKVSNCQMPASVLRKLGLSFDIRAGNKRIYSNVPPVKELDEKPENIEEKVMNHNKGREDDSGNDNDDDQCQEYERHEGTHTINVQKHFYAFVNPLPVP